MKCLFVLICSLLICTTPHIQANPVNKTLLKNALTESLMDRINHRDTQGVKALLKQDADPNQPDARGVRPLFNAVQSGLGMVQILIAAGANPRLLGFENNTLLHEAAEHPQIVRFLLASGFNPNARNDRKRTPLMWAADAGNIESVRLLLNAGANVTAIDADGYDALMQAIRTNNVALVRLLERNGASFKGIEAFAVSSAASASATEMLRFLASRKFSFKVVDDEGNSPLVACIFANDADERGDDADSAVVPAIQALIDGGAEIDKSFALYFAAERGQDAIVKTLLKAGANPNIIGGRRQFPIEGAIARLSFDETSYGRIIEDLIKAGTRLDTRDSQTDQTLLMNLAKTNQIAYIERLAVPNDKLNVNAPAKKGETALMLAAHENAVSGVKWLLEHGANPNLRDHKGQTASDYISKGEVVIEGWFLGIGDSKKSEAQADEILKNRAEVARLIKEAQEGQALR